MWIWGHWWYCTIRVSIHRKYINLIQNIDFFNTNLYESDIGIEGGIDEYIDDIVLPKWFIFNRDGDNDVIGICAPPIKLFCKSVGPGVPASPWAVVVIFELVVWLIPELALVLPTLVVGVRLWLRNFSSLRHLARLFENQTYCNK